MAGFLSTTELDFDTLKSNLKTFLQNQTAFQDYDFEGSNISILLDLLAYNTYMNGHYLNMIGSEMFLDTAVLKESIVSHAKELNYVPRSRASSKAEIDITIVPGDTPSEIIIPKNYRLTSTIGGVKASFLIPEQIIIKPVSGIYSTGTIEAYEGELVTEKFTANVTLNGGFVESAVRYNLLSANVDTSSITVNVQQSNTNSANDTFTFAENLFGVSSDANVYFLQGYGDDYYEVVFGNGVLGKALDDGNIVTITYRDTLGADGDGASAFTKTNSIDGYTNITAETISASTEGASRETSADIQYNAPRYFQTQSRAVTAGDYITLVKAQFPEVQAVTAYGGEVIQQYGRVIISVKPFGVAGIATQSLKDRIVEYLKLKSMTTEPIIVDPDYFYLGITSTISYDPLLISAVTPAQIKTLTNSTLLALNNTSFNDFGKDLRYSKVITTIDAVDDSIVSNDTDIKLIYRWSPSLNSIQSLSVDFGQALKEHTISSAHSASHDAYIETSAFTYTSGGTAYTAFIQDDGAGTLFIYRFDDDGLTRIILDSNVGTVNYDTGVVEFSTTVTGFTGTHINVIASTRSKDIVVSKNRFLIVDLADVSVTVAEASA
jgi:hypothetical protein